MGLDRRGEGPSHSGSVVGGGVDVAQETGGTWQGQRDAGVKLTVRELPPGEDQNGRPLILVEGDAATLELVGRLFLAMSKYADCGFFLGPDGPGQALFSAESSYGLYIHRIPCVHVAEEERGR